MKPLIDLILPVPFRFQTVIVSGTTVGLACRGDPLVPSASIMVVGHPAPTTDQLGRPGYGVFDRTWQFQATMNESAGCVTARQPTFGYRPGGKSWPSVTV